MAREVRIPHELIQTPEAITRHMEERFKDEGLNLHVHEVERFDDDEKRRERVLQIKNTKYVFLS